MRILGESKVSEVWRADVRTDGVLEGSRGGLLALLSQAGVRIRVCLRYELALKRSSVHDTHLHFYTKSRLYSHELRTDTHVCTLTGGEAALSNKTFGTRDHCLNADTVHPLSRHLNSPPAACHLPVFPLSSSPCYLYTATPTHPPLPVYSTTTS